LFYICEYNPSHILQQRDSMSTLFEQPTSVLILIELGFGNRLRKNVAILFSFNFQQLAPSTHAKFERFESLQQHETRKKQRSQTSYSGSHLKVPVRKQFVLSLGSTGFHLDCSKVSSLTCAHPKNCGGIYCNKICKC